MSHRRVPPGVVACALLALAVCGGTAAAVPQPPGQVALPNKPDTLHFAVIGDNGTGDKPEYVIAEQMLAWHNRFPFPLVIMMGDNIYGSDRPQDFVAKFEAPYKGLLDKGVKFYACLGNHDSREQRYYKLFNMDGKLYYSFKAPKEDVRFFVLESSYPDPEQIQWIEDELKNSKE